MPLMALNHITCLCKSIDGSIRFYAKALVFVLIHCLPALDFSGALYGGAKRPYFSLRRLLRTDP